MNKRDLSLKTECTTENAYHGATSHFIWEFSSFDVRCSKDFLEMLFKPPAEHWESGHHCTKNISPYIPFILNNKYSHDSSVTQDCVVFSHGRRGARGKRSKTLKGWNHPLWGFYSFYREDCWANNHGEYQHVSSGSCHEVQQACTDQKGRFHKDNLCWQALMTALHTACPPLLCGRYGLGTASPRRKLELPPEEPRSKLIAATEATRHLAL